MPIISEAEAKEMTPDYFLVLPGHFKSSIIKREEKFLSNGGNFIFPLPFIEIYWMLAIIIGSKGQDGTFLIKHLKSLSYEIIEIDVNHFFSEKSLKLNQLDISDYNDVENFVRLSKPSEIYYLAAYHQ